MTRLYGKIIAVFNKILGAIGLKANKDVIADEFSPSKSYHAGDIVMRGDVAYRCLVDRGAGAWDDQHFQITDVGLELNRRLLESEVGPRYERQVHKYNGTTGIDLEINLQGNLVSSYLLENEDGVDPEGKVSILVNMPEVGGDRLPTPSFLCMQTHSSAGSEVSVDFKIDDGDRVCYRGARWNDVGKNVSINISDDEVYLEIRCLGNFGESETVGKVWVFTELDYFVLDNPI